MAPDAPRPRIQQVTSTGTTLAVTFAPLVIGVLLARTMALDPMSHVNALITRTGHGPGVSPAQWRGCGRSALRRCRTLTPGPGAVCTGQRARSSVSLSRAGRRRTATAPPSSAARPRPSLRRPGHATA